MQSRIYAVTEKFSGLARLIEAQSPAQAIKHVANDMFEVKAATAAVVAKLMSGGAKLEAAKPVEQDEPAKQTALAEAA